MKRPLQAEAAGLLAAILEQPDDTRARLVYADLLQERGDPRGELIAVQCALADLPAGDRAVALEQRATELLAKHRKKWTTFGASGARYEFRRGFVETASIDADDLQVAADTIFAVEPVEELCVRKIADSSISIDGSKLEPVLDLPLHRVRRLVLARNELTPRDVAALAVATTLGSVEILDLTKTALGVEGVIELAKATSLPKLRELRLGNCRLGESGIRALANSQTLRFTHLYLPHDDLEAEAMAALVAAPWAPQLVHLDLSGNMLFDDGLRILAESSRLSALRSLALVYTGLAGAAADLVLGSPVFARLEDLDLSTTSVDIDRIRAVFGDRVWFDYDRRTGQRLQRGR